MTRMILNGLLAGFAVIAVSEIARRFPRVADVILSVPLVVFAVYAVMYARDGQLAPLSRMARHMLVLIPLSLPFFLPIAFAARLNLTFWPAFSIGLALVTLTVGGYLWLTA